MRGRSFPKQETKDGMELDKLSKLKEEPHLSGAYIRSLVKQLSSSRTNDHMNPKNQESIADSANSPTKHLTKHSDVLGESKPAEQTTQPQQHKKQVRRRLHTSRPHRERLLNMAEARREIVTALKYHRAAMKQASEERQQPSQDQQQPLSHTIELPHQPYFEQDGRIKSGGNLRIYPSNTINFPNDMDSYSFPPFSQVPTPAANPFWWSAASPVAPPLHSEHPNFVLPDQTLGLNLNFHDFTNIEATPYHSRNKMTWHSGFSPSSSSPPLSIATDQEAPLVAISQGEGLLSAAPMYTSLKAAGLHASMNDEEIADIRSIGEQYEMEWNDTMNLVASARWFKFLKSMELGTPEVKAEENDSFDVFDVMEFPSWSNAKDSFLEQCSEEYSQDPTSPCMDIGDIEVMDGDWWA